MKDILINEINGEITDQMFFDEMVILLTDTKTGFVSYDKIRFILNFIKDKNSLVDLSERERLIKCQEKSNEIKLILNGFRYHIS